MKLQGIYSLQIVYNDMVNHQRNMIKSWRENMAIYVCRVFHNVKQSLASIPQLLDPNQRSLRTLPRSLGVFSFSAQFSEADRYTDSGRWRSSVTGWLESSRLPTLTFRYLYRLTKHVKIQKQIKYVNNAHVMQL